MCDSDGINTIKGAISKCLYALGIIAFPLSASEFSNENNIDLHGSFRAGYFSSSLMQDNAGEIKNDLGSGSLWLKALYSFDSNISFLTNGWVRNDDITRDGNAEYLLREGYVNIATDNIDFRIGKQIMMWGRADRLNPTDNLSWQNFKWLIPQYEEHRYGEMAAKAAYHFNTSYSLTGIVMPNQKSAKNQFALKLDDTGDTIDWSVSYFHGLDKKSDYQLQVLENSSYAITEEHNQIEVLGMDASTTFGRYGFRTEIAYTWTDYNAENNQFIKKPFLYAVIGIDRTFFENLNINVQYYEKHIDQYRNPESIMDLQIKQLAIKNLIAINQLDKIQRGISLRIANKWLNETLEGELASQFSINRNDYVVQPRLIYAFNDALFGTLGMDIYRGGSLAFYGQLEDNSSIFVELKRSF